MDPGPWTVLHNIAGKAVGLLSDDFKRDVLLRVDGDFADDDEKSRYCKWLAETLNSTRGADSAGGG